MTQLQERPAPPRASGAHKRPFVAFVLVALVCGLVFGNALRSEAFRSVLRTAVDNIVSSSSLVHDRANQSAPARTDTVPLAMTAAVTDQPTGSTYSATRPGLAKGHGKDKAEGEARGHAKAHPGQAKGLDTTPPGLAKGHSQGKAQGQARGHRAGTATTSNATGHARAARGGHTRGHDRAQGRGHAKDGSARGQQRR